MDRTAIEKIEEMAQARKLKFGDREFTDKHIFPVREAECDPVTLRTLTGLRSFYSTSVENGSIQADGYTVIVEAVDRVSLVSGIYGPTRQREVLAEVDDYPVEHFFDRYLSLEKFNVYLQSCFVQDATTKDILKVTGNIVVGAEASYTDDGTTQRVTAKAGITRVENIVVPNPVTLRPYRTFPEVEQPREKLVLRLKAGGEKEKPTAALFEADGGRWRNEATANIGAYLTELFADTPVSVVC